MAAKDKKVVLEETKKLLDLLGVEGEVDVVEKDGVFEITLDSQDSGIIIGHHGDTLDSLQLIISLCVERKIGEFRQISLDIGDYKKKRVEKLEQMARDAKEKVVESGEEVSLLMLKPWERRIVHLILQEDDNVASLSVGEGRDRVLVVKPKAS